MKGLDHLSGSTLSKAFSRSNTSKRVLVFVVPPFVDDSPYVVGGLGCAFVFAKPVLCALEVDIENL